MANGGSSMAANGYQWRKSYQCYGVMASAISSANVMANHQLINDTISMKQYRKLKIQ